MCGQDFAAKPSCPCRHHSRVVLSPMPALTKCLSISPFFRQPKDASSIGVEERVLDVGDVQRSSSIVSSVPLKQDEDLKYLQEGLLKGHAVDNTYEGLHFSWDYIWQETVLSVEGSHFWLNGLTPVLAPGWRQPSVRHLNEESFLLPLHTRRL